MLIQREFSENKLNLYSVFSVLYEVIPYERLSEIHEAVRSKLRGRSPSNLPEPLSVSAITRVRCGLSGYSNCYVLTSLIAMF